MHLYILYLIFNQKIHNNASSEKRPASTKNQLVLTGYKVTKEKCATSTIFPDQFVLTLNIEKFLLHVEILRQVQ